MVTLPGAVLGKGAASLEVGFAACIGNTIATFEKMGKMLKPVFGNQGNFIKKLNEQAPKVKQTQVPKTGGATCYMVWSQATVSASKSLHLHIWKAEVPAPIVLIDKGLTKSPSLAGALAGAYVLWRPLWRARGGRPTRDGCICTGTVRGVETEERAEKVTSWRQIDCRAGREGFAVRAGW